MVNSNKINIRNIFVSIIIPTYNRSKTLIRAINSVLSQTYAHYEIIIIDDASTDTTNLAVQSFIDRGINIKYIRLPYNMGPSAARNIGIRESCGDVIAFLDDDDEWLPNKLERQIERLITNPNAGAVYSGWYVIDSSNESVLDIRYPKARGYIFRKLLVKNVVGCGCSSLIVKKEFFNKVGNFDINFKASEDREMWLRLSKSCYFDYVKEPLVKYYHKDEGKRSGNIEKEIEAYMLQIIKHQFYYNFYRRELGFLYFQIAKMYLRSGNIVEFKEALRKAFNNNPFSLLIFLTMIISAIDSKLTLKFYKLSKRMRKQITIKIIKNLKKLNKSVADPVSWTQTWLKSGRRL